MAEGLEEEEDAEVVQIEEEAAVEKEREHALKRRQEAVARVSREEQEKAELAQQAEEVDCHFSRASRTLTSDQTKAYYISLFPAILKQLDSNLQAHPL